VERISTSTRSTITIEMMTTAWQWRQSEEAMAMQSGGRRHARTRGGM
jgi:hypothetical protein